MKPFITHPETAEPYVLASHIGISEQAVQAEDLSAITINGVLYISLTECIEFLEESVDDVEHLEFFKRALTSYVRGDWHPD